jgi:NAD(P)-dependent dehydrogenase (short-subunit alcohol dehydrogenase family)
LASHDLEGKVAIVTGGANGLGRGAAERLLQSGVRVWISDIDPRVEEIAAEIGAVGRLSDASNAAHVDDLFAACLAEEGTIDIVVANAGMGGGAPVVDLSDELYRRIMAVNLDSVFFTCRAAARTMLAQGSGSIVTVSSVFGRDAPAGSSAYGASKAGVIAVTQSLAKELAPSGIRVNCVSPGHMATELYWAALRRRAAASGHSFDETTEDERTQVKLGRFGTPEDFGELVAFLASDAASYITGQTINLDGGLQMR